jgi:hypothetical protein
MLSRGPEPELKPIIILIVVVIYYFDILWKKGSDFVRSRHLRVGAQIIVTCNNVLLFIVGLLLAANFFSFIIVIQSLAALFEFLKGISD